MTKGIREHLDNRKKTKQHRLLLFQKKIKVLLRVFYFLLILFF